MEFNIGSVDSIAKRLGKSPGNKIHLQKFKQLLYEKDQLGSVTIGLSV
jgi:hypothetical protein